MDDSKENGPSEVPDEIREQIKAEVREQLEEAEEMGAVSFWFRMALEGRGRSVDDRLGLRSITSISNFVLGSFVAVAAKVCRDMRELIDYIEGLTLTQGRFEGQPFQTASVGKSGSSGVRSV